MTVVATTAAHGEQGGLLDSAWRDPGAATAAMERLRAELGPGAVVRAVARDTHRPEQAAAWVEATLDEAGANAAVRGAPAYLTKAAAKREGAQNNGRHPERAPKARGEGSASADKQVLRFAQDDGDKQVLRSAQADDKVPGSAALRMLAPPAAVTVECAAGAPHTLWWQGRRVTLEHVQGPERLGGEWWTDPWQRDYWRGEGALDGDAPADLVLYRERIAGAAASADPDTGAADSAHTGRWFLQGWYD